MKLDEAKWLIDGSSIVEETLTTLSVSRFTETTNTSVKFDGKSSTESRKFSMDTEDNMALVANIYTDFARSGMAPKIGANSSKQLEHPKSGKRSQSSTVKKYFDEVARKESGEEFKSSRLMRDFANLHQDEHTESKDVFCEFSIENPSPNF